MQHTLRCNVGGCPDRNSWFADADAEAPAPSLHTFHQLGGPHRLPSFRMLFELPFEKKKKKRPKTSARRVLMRFTGKFELEQGRVRWVCSCGTKIGPKWKDVHNHHNKAKAHTPRGAYEKNQKTNKLPVRRCLLHGLI